MEANIAKLVHIVGGILIGVVLLSLISYFFSSIGLLPSQEDETESREQLAKFNLEYEIYDKKGMYGVDVISCLNKAASNNLKYVEGTHGFLSGNKYGNEFTVNVYVKINTPLEENIAVYYFDEITNKEEQRFSEDSNTKKIEIAGIEELNAAKYYTAFSKDDKLFTQPKKLDDKPDKYILPNGGTHQIELEDGTKQNYYSIKDNQLKNLLNFSSTDFKITKKN